MCWYTTHSHNTYGTLSTSNTANNHSNTINIHHSSFILSHQFLISPNSIRINPHSTIPIILPSAIHSHPRLTCTSTSTSTNCRKDIPSSSPQRNIPLQILTSVFASFSSSHPSNTTLPIAAQHKNHTLQDISRHHSAQHCAKPCQPHRNIYTLSPTVTNPFHSYGKLNHRHCNTLLSYLRDNTTISPSSPKKLS